MTEIKIQAYSEGILYLELGPQHTWARSEFPTDTLTLDFAANGELIGIELVKGC